MNSKKLISLVAVMALSLSLFVNNANAATTTMELEVLGATSGVTIYNPSTFDFGQINTAATTQNKTVRTPLEGNGSGSAFSVEDLKGSTTWSVTMHVGNLTTGGKTASETITANNVAVFLPDLTDDALSGSNFGGKIDGTNNADVVHNVTNTELEIGSAPVTWMSKTTASSVLSHYGILPEFKVYVPAYRSLGSYTGTLTLTLQEV